MSRRASPRNDRSPSYRLLTKLPFEIVSPRFGRCRLEYREQTERTNRSVFLVELDHPREWLVHAFGGPAHAIAEFVLYERSIAVAGEWQVRLFECLVQQGRAQKVELD